MNRLHPSAVDTDTGRRRAEDNPARDSALCAVPVADQDAAGTFHHHGVSILRQQDPNGLFRTDSCRVRQSEDQYRHLRQACHPGYRLRNLDSTMRSRVSTTLMTTLVARGTYSVKCSR